jgi:hypothetical protein
MSKMFNLFKLFNVLLLSSLFLGCLGVDKTANGESTTSVPNTSPTPSATPKITRFIDFNIKGIRLGDMESDVLQKLGKPTSRRVKKVDYCGINEFLELGYSGLKFKLDRSNGKGWFVLEIIVTSPNVLIDPGVKIGDERNLLLEKFGEPFTETQDGNNSDLYYVTRDDDNADFSVHDNKVVGVRLYINPC